MLKNVIYALCLFVCLSAALAVNAAAYLDPSAMTYIIQAVAGVVIAGGAAIVIYWRKIKLFFKKKKKDKKISSAKNKDENRSQR